MILLLVKYILFSLIIVLLLIKFSKYFISSYYSTKRYFIGSKLFIHNKKFYLYYFLLLLSFIIYFFNNNIIYLFFIIDFYLYLILPKINLKYKRRGIILFLFSLLFSLFAFLNDFLLIFIFFILYIIVPISNLILLPSEKIIQKYYLIKARKKIKKYHPLIIGITGSFGKTTFKEYLGAALKVKYKVLYSKNNYNTLMGLTKFINTSLNKPYDILILEMGIDVKHGILKFKELCSLDFAVIVGVGKVHLSTFKTYQNIIISKCEIEKLLTKKGILFVNGNYQELVSYVFEHKTYYYNMQKELKDLNTFQNIALGGVKLICNYLHLKEKEFAYFLNNIPQVPRRFELIKGDDYLLINDSYNINYIAMKENIKYMNSLKGVKIIITGGLIELGKDYIKDNLLLGKEMHDIDYLFLLSENKNHPLTKSFKQKLYIIKNINESKKIIEQITGYKIILLSAKGNDFFLN